LYGGGRSINNTNFGICYIFHNFLKTIQKLGNTYIKSSIALRNFKMHLKAKYDNLSVMDREINVDYSPAVLSYLYNNKLEPKKDILSTILNLYNKKVMTIEKDENGYNFIPMKEADLTKLTPDEQYIYYSFVEDKENAKLFSSEDWRKIVEEEYQKCNFSDKRQEKMNNKITQTFTIIIDFIIVFLLKNKLLLMLFGSSVFDKQISNLFIRICMTILFLIVGWIISIIIVFLVYNSILEIREILSKLNENGKREIVKWIKFKKFIKGYTLLNERKIEEIVLFEKYIPYAMTLNINKEYNNKDIKDFVNYYMQLTYKGTGKYLYYGFNSQNNK